MAKVRTRFAPSPTGRMHVGNLRTALYTYLIAKHEDGDFILRIEDTDQERFQEGAVDIIYRTLEKTGLIHDEGPDKDGGCGPYVQSERCRQGIYMKYAKQLIEQGDAYYCFCDKERLEGLKQVVAGKEISVYDKHCLHLSKEEIQANLDAGKPYVIRINMPTEGTTTFHDVIYGDITVNNEELDDMILIKSDGFPTYNFANVIDDHLMGITHVVRGNEYLSSAPKYNRLYEAFGWEVPEYIHCPLITNEEHKKLSKRSGHSSYEDLIEQGFLSEAVVNYVALLGWSPAEDREIYSLPELVKAFDYRRINKSPAVFDNLGTAQERAHLKNRVAGVGHQHHITGIAQCPADMGHGFLGTVHGHDLFRIQLHAKPSVVKILHGFQQRRALHQRILVVLRLAGRFCQCLHHMRCRFEIRGTNRKIVNGSSLGQQLIFLLIQYCENSFLKGIHTLCKCDFHNQSSPFLYKLSTILLLFAVKSISSCKNDFQLQIAAASAIVYLWKSIKF